MYRTRPLLQYEWSWSWRLCRRSAKNLSRQRLDHYYNMNDLDLDDFVDAAVQKTSITIFNLLDTKGNDCVDFPSFLSFLVDLGLVKNFLGGHNCLNCLRQTFNNIKEKDSEYVTFASLLQHLQQQHIDNTKIDLIPINLISKDISNLIISTAPILSTVFPILTIISNRSTRTASRNKLLQANHIITEYGMTSYFVVIVNRIVCMAI